MRLFCSPQWHVRTQAHTRARAHIDTHTHVHRVPRRRRRRRAFRKTGCCGTVVCVCVVCACVRVFLRLRLGESVRLLSWVRAYACAYAHTRHRYVLELSKESNAPPPSPPRAQADTDIAHQPVNRLGRCAFTLVIFWPIDTKADIAPHIDR